MEFFSLRMRIVELTIKANIGSFLLAFSFPFIAIFCCPIELFDTFMIKSSTRCFLSSFSLIFLSFHTFTTTFMICWKIISMIFSNNFIFIEFSSLILKKSNQKKKMLCFSIRTRRDSNSFKRANRSARLSVVGAFSVLIWNTEWNNLIYSIVLCFFRGKN